MSRVAQANVAPERLARVRSEVRAKEHEPVEITEHFKPGIEEIAAVLPPKWAKRLLAWGERPDRHGRPRTGRLYFSMHLRSTTILGFARLRLLAALRSWRPRTWRYAEEQAAIEGDHQFYGEVLEEFATFFRASPGRERYEVVFADEPTRTG